VGVVQEPIEDGVGQGGLAEVFMPVFDGQLTGDEGGFAGYRLNVLLEIARLILASQKSLIRKTMNQSSGFLDLFLHGAGRFS
jgi:hypothetical protein